MKTIKIATTHYATAFNAMVKGGEFLLCTQNVQG
jgi:hypothetical protein